MSVSQSLGLIGHYFYLQFRVLPGKIFIFHIDVAAEDGVVVRLSFSNLFKVSERVGCTASHPQLPRQTFKSTSTCLQFPFVEASDKWTLLTLDLRLILLLYLNKRFMYTKGFKLCAHMFVRGVFTSANLYDHQSLPRDMLFFLAKV
jgi:hypothetical protein